MAKKKQFITAAAAFAVAGSAVAPAITADAATSTVRLSSDYVRGGDLDAALDKEYKGSEIYWYKSSVDMNKLGVFQKATGFVKGKGIKVEKSVRVLNYAKAIQPKEIVLEEGVPASGLRIQPVLFADGVVYNKVVNVEGFSTEKAGEFEGTFTYTNKAYGTVSKTVKYKVVASKVELSEVKSEVMDDVLSVTADVKNLKDGEKVELVVYANRDMNAALPAVQAEVKDGKLSVKSGKLPAGNHSFILRSGEVKTDVMNFVVEAPMVKEVKAINAKQTVIKFNKAIAKDSVIGAAPANTLQNITIVGDASAQAVSGLSAELSEDGTELTVTAGTGFFNGDYTVTASDSVKTTANKSLTPYIAKITAEDKVAPVVSKVEYNQVNDKFEVSLSEPITSLTGQVIRVNGNPVSSFDAITGPTKKLSFDRPSGVALGSTATIYVAGLSDAAGNLMTSFNGSAVLTQDQAALTVTSVKQISNNVARVTFNKRLSTASDTALKAKTGVVVTNQTGATTTNYTIASAPASEDANSLSYDVTFADASFATNNPEVFTLTLVKDAFTDLVGNKNALFSQTISLSKDNVAPVVTSSKLSSDKKTVEVTLSEPISGGSIDGTKVKLRKDGAELTGVTATLKPNTNNVLLVTTTDTTAVNGDATFKAGSYQVRFEAEAFADLNGVKNAAVNVAPVAVASTPGSALSVTVGSGGTNIFTVTAPANQTFATGSLAYTNFAIDGKVIPSNSDITLNPARTVISVKLPASDSVAISGNALFNVTGLSLESGASVSNASATVAIVDNTAALLTSAQKVGNTLVLTFNENLSTSANDADINEVLSNYEIKSGTNLVGPGTGAATAALVAGSNNKVQITFSNVTGTNYNASETITIKTTSTGGDVADANGVRVKGGVTVTAN